MTSQRLRSFFIMVTILSSVKLIASAQPWHVVVMSVVAIAVVGFALVELYRIWRE